MNLKALVASMSLLGFVCCPVFAATTAKHKHHKVKHQMVAAQHEDYKDMGALPMKDVPACTISQDTMIMTGMSQNMGRSIPDRCNPGWFNRIALSGGINVDLGKFGNRNGNFMGENYQRFSLNDAYVNLAADINDWAKAFASISYNTATIHAPNSNSETRLVTLTSGSGRETVAVPVTFPLPNAEYSSSYSNNVTSGGNSTLQIEQAFATFGNFNESPLFIQVGKQFLDFSRYELHPITRSLTQVMSESNPVQGKIGFLTNGFHGDIYAFDDPISKTGQTTTTTNYGAALGFDAPSDCLGWDIGAGYVYNLVGINDVAYVVNQANALEEASYVASYPSITVVPGSFGGYHTRVAGGALYADVNSGPFTVGVRYTTALQRFNAMDLPKNLSYNATTNTWSATGAKPWAAGIEAGYGFEGWGKNQNIYAGYQSSRDAGALFLPKNRWTLGYGVDMFGHNTNVGVEWNHDTAYSVSQLGSGNNSNLVTIRSSVKFG